MLIKSHKRAAEELGLSNPGKAWKYIFVDVEKFNDHADRDKLEWCIEVVQLMNITGQQNKLQKDLGLDKQIDGSIGGEVITAILTETSFTDEQLDSYFTWQKEMEAVYKIMDKWLSEDYYLPYQVEYLLLGMPFEEVLESRNCELLSEPYGELSINYLCNKKTMSQSEFIRQAKELVQGAVNSVPS